MGGSIVSRRLDPFLAVLFVAACNGPVGVKAVDGSSSGDVTLSAATGVMGSSGTSGGAGPPPHRGTGGTTGDEPSACDREWGGEIDGAPVRKCVVLIDGPGSRFHAVDLDGDGRDELFVDNSSALGGPALFRWVDGELVGGVLDLNSAAYMVHCGVRYDFDGDGVRDLDCLGVGIDRPVVWKNLETTIGAFIPQVDFAPRIQTASAAVLVDPNLDGLPERMVTIAWPPEIGGFGLFREEAGELVQDGPRYALGGCARPSSVAYADFDEDGIDDVVVLDDPRSCDPYPTMYDPTWHRSHVLLTRPETETMDLVASVPTGDVVKSDFTRIYATDITQDGHADIVLPLEAPGGLISVAAGRGDGSFESTIKYTAADVGLPEDTQALLLGEFDGDPWPEIVAKNYLGRAYVLDDPSGDLRLLEVLTFEGAIRGIVDLDGDGIDDLVVGPYGQIQTLLLLSGG